jgi:hypothetical protein
MSRRPILLAVALALLLALLPGLAAAMKKPFADLAALDDARLDQLRGGLDAGQGLILSIGLERVVTIDGTVMTRQLLTFNDLSVLLQGGIPTVEFIAAATQIVQNGTGNTVGSRPLAPAVPIPPTLPSAPGMSQAIQAGTATPGAGGAGGSPPVAAAAAATPSAAPVAAAAPPAAAAPNAAPAGTPVSASAAPAPPTASAATAAAPVAAPAPQSLTQPMTIQTPAGTVTVNLPNTALIVQNTLNNVSIQINTALSAALNSASLARALVLSGQIR